jgi:hypothetical protein
VKTALLALLLSQEPAIFHAAEPPPGTAREVIWRYGEVSAPGIWLTEDQSRFVVARMDACEAALIKAQVDAAKLQIPTWVWVSAGFVVGGAVAWTVGGLVR